MIRMLSESPDNVLTLSVAGTVIGHDVETVVGAWLEEHEDHVGHDRLVIEIEPDFEGYDAELVRALSHFVEPNRCFERLAIVADANFSPFARAMLARSYRGELQFFPTSKMNSSIAWAAA